ncbi:hypothetical protein HHK36_016778 [Tetracentron sinense]|uniref:Protein FAR1-RELATED SEQUENCE n=1 Tax=Tetracentron sinense TaxID=13715 RepID=A0A834Z411_TETSI|nr:hypothetical protein HHK36_016778 [Tetracentron sinense]
MEIDFERQVDEHVMEDLEKKEFDTYEEAYSVYREYAKSIGFEKDVRNQFDKERRLAIEAGDAQAMLEHFTHLQKDNPDFFYAMDLNDDQQLRNVFWVDAKKEQFENRWLKMVDTFELNENEWVKSSYEDRKQWVPTFMRNTFFAGMSTTQRSESINSFFDKYVQKKTTLNEFIEQYKVAIQDRREMETKADFDTWHKIPTLKSYSPYEKQMSTFYTHEIFKKFQVEVLGVVACHPKKEKEHGSTITFMVHDFEAKEDFTVVWDETKSDLCCLFEHKGFLCRHAMVILQFSVVPKIPAHYLLRRWSKDVKGSLSQDSSNIEVCTLEEVKNTMHFEAVEERFIHASFSADITTKTTEEFETRMEF